MPWAWRESSPTPTPRTAHPSRSFADAVSRRARPRATGWTSPSIAGSGRRVSGQLKHPDVDIGVRQYVGDQLRVGVALVVRHGDRGRDGPVALGRLVWRHRERQVDGKERDVHFAQVGELGNALGVACDVDAQIAEV